jgi:hypothetical protein
MPNSVPHRPLLILVFALALAMASCTPYRAPGSDRKLLVDRDASRYGKILTHAETRTLPIVRGAGIAELFVPVRIGTSAGWWQIDTGAALCVVNTRIARTEGFLPVAEGEIVTAAGAVDSQLGRLPSVQLGGLEIRDVTALSFDDDYTREFRVQGRRGNVIGILGADLLDRLGATIDLPANLIRLRIP